MLNEISLLVEDLPQEDVELFTKNTKSTLSATQKIDKISVDYSWIDFVEESIPYLDNIIRNPRRFIVSEEDVIPIEKTKRVSEESIKHLAIHTNLIQEVDDDGFVKPIKLLNVFREETIDLYENRFIYSLIVNLNIFVNEQMTYNDQSESNNDIKTLSYEALTSFKEQNVSIKLELTTEKDENYVTDIEANNKKQEEYDKRTERLKAISDVLASFMSSRFMQMMNNATKVRSPIRKTNVILKDQNFVMALKLWEFMESFQVSKPVKEVHEEVDLLNNSMNASLDLSYYLDYCILNNVVSKKGTITAPKSVDLVESIFEYAKNFDTNEKDLRKRIESKLNEAANYKNIQKSEARKAYRTFVANHQIRIDKALALIR